MTCTTCYVAFEPHAPAPSQRLKCLQEAKAAGLNVYVAVAPTYPECDIADFTRTLEAIRPLDPVTVFMEPINIRAENIARIEAHAASIGATVNTAPFKSPWTWRRYAVDAMRGFAFAAANARLQGQLHLWPDATLGSREAQKEAAEWDRGAGYEPHLRWLQHWWSRVSEWPTTAATGA